MGILDDGTTVDEALGSFLKECREKNVRINALVVIGSRARGGWKPWSDIDLVIVTEDMPLEDRMAPFLHAYRYGIEPRPYRPPELLKATRRGDVAAIEALEEGIPIYDDGTWGRLKLEFEKIKKELGLKKTEIGWVAEAIEKRAMSRKGA